MATHLAMVIEQARRWIVRGRATRPASFNGVPQAIRPGPTSSNSPHPCRD